MNHKLHFSWFLIGCVCIIASIFSYKHFFSQKEKPNTWYQSDVVAKEPVSITPLLFTGDVMLGRYVEKAINEKGDEYLFGDGIEDLFISHTTIINLEGPIPEKHVKTPINGFQFSFPTTTVNLLNTYSVEAVSLANNHSLDWGIAGYTHTKKVLDNARIAHFGAYSTTAPDYFETKLGTTTVIVYGINMISSSWNEAKAIETTQVLRKQHPDAHLIAYVHWGEEYKHNQSVDQRILAHTLIDTGVDTIIGSHPHVVQGIEVYKEKYIFYSLGNFTFDQYFSEETQYGYTLSITKIDGDIVSTIIPVVSNRSRVSVATSTRVTSILDVIAKSSPKELHEDIKRGILPTK